MQLKSIFPFFGEPTAAAADTIIATETEFRGDIRSERKIQINGAVIGNVIGPSGAEHCITVGAQGSVVGDILARHIEIAGKIAGLSPNGCFLAQPRIPWQPRSKPLVHIRSDVAPRKQEVFVPVWHVGQKCQRHARQGQEKSEVIGEVGECAGDGLARYDLFRFKVDPICGQNELGLGFGGGGAGTQRRQGATHSISAANGQVNVVAQ